MAIDGETLRGCHDRNGRGALHLISPGRRRTGWCWGTTGIPALLRRGGVWSPLTPWGVNGDEGRVTLDPIDELQRSCELKVSAGAEPAQITMAGAEVRRARTTPDFFVVVISAGIPQIKPTFLDIAPSGIPSNIIPHSKGIKCGLIRSNSPFSYSNHRPAKPKIPKPLVYAQVSPLGTSFATP